MEFRFRYSVTAIASTPKGIAAACGPGLVHWFERTEETKSMSGGGGLTSSMTSYLGALAGGVRECYRRVRTINIPVDPNGGVIESSLAHQQLITHLVVSPSEDILVASSQAHQLFQHNLASAEMAAASKGSGVFPGSSRPAFTGDKSNLPISQNADVEQATFDPVAQAFHHGQILGLDTCSRKPLIVTCAVDRSVRVWNFETK
ncbi:unnamed protein product [Protopolystoma xenopodis]|uniref:Uncharacterized protein n=1 Tax=Protopolystoma xenopodis TaxID=117903 RepID=A0A3S5CH56_9PLAT|nr:unnamed protein product [Protopolystoma xenopodis]